MLIEHGQGRQRSEGWKCQNIDSPSVKSSRLYLSGICSFPNSMFSRIVPERIQGTCNLKISLQKRLKGYKQKNKIACVIPEARML